MPPRHPPNGLKLLDKLTKDLDGPVGFDSPVIDLPSFLDFPQSFQRLPVIVETLRIVWPALRIIRQHVAGILVLTNREIHGPQLAEDFVLAVPFVLIEHRLKVPKRV